MLFEYQAIIVAVHDGDSITVNVDMGFSVWLHKLQLRLVGIDAPELKFKNGKAARDYLSIQLPVGTKIRVQTLKDKKEKFGRYLGRIFKDTVNINDLLIKTGHAKVYHGGKRS